MTLRSAIDGALSGPSALPSLAAWKGRAVWWPVASTSMGVRLLLKALQDGVVPVLIAPGLPPEKLAQLRAAYSGFGLVTRAGDISGGAGPEVRVDRRVLLALMTSGSTGAPKLIAATAEALDLGLDAIHAAQGLEDVASTALLLSPSYSYALVNQVLWSVRFGRRLLHPPSLATPADALAAIRDGGAQMLCLVAHQARLLRRLGFGATAALPSVRVVNFAGAPFPVAELGWLRALFPRARFLNNYGCTEALPRLTVCEVDDERHPVGRVGRAMAGVELRIAGAEDPDPIEFRAPSASIGRLLADGRVQPHPEWIPTGDVGRLREGVLEVFGRHDQVINCRGERISLLEIEQALQRLPGVEHALAWAERGSDGEEVPRALLSGAHAPDADVIGRLLAAHLSRNAWPASIEWVEAWAVTSVGKTDRAALKAQAAAGRLRRLWSTEGS
jgi:O-succinylbenzoic acid--CoA ligase